MGPSKRRGSRVIYVASSARELPEEVQDWLSQAGHSAAACGDIYDALALLAMGRQPLALIVHVECVDWGEMDFFDHVAQLARQTRVFVAGQDHHQAKLDAACARGARCFDAQALTAELGTAASGAGGAFEAGGLLAGSLRTSRGAGSDADTDEASDMSCDTQTDPRIHRHPQVRLVAPVDPNEEEEGAAFPLPVPWVKNPHRPQRTPPASAGSGDGGSSVAADRSAEQEARCAHPSPVELTPEELAALLGKHRAGKGDAAKERQG